MHPSVHLAVCIIIIGTNEIPGNLRKLLALIYKPEIIRFEVPISSFDYRKSRSGAYEITVATLRAPLGSALSLASPR